MTDYIWLIAGMALVTYIPRVAPLVLFSSRALPEWVLRWLGMIPPAVLAALLFPELLLQTAAGKKELFLSWHNVVLLASLPSVLVGLWSKSFFATVATGMASVAALRYFGV